jgi:hypothetical protein
MHMLKTILAYNIALLLHPICGALKFCFGAVNYNKDSKLYIIDGLKL